MIHRIRSRREFDRLAGDGRRIRGASLWCTYLPDPSMTPPRVGFSVGRAVGPAVVRNRLRRRLRAMSSAAARDGRLPPGTYLLGATTTRASITAVELTFEQLQSEFDLLLNRIAPLA